MAMPYRYVSAPQTSQSRRNRTSRVHTDNALPLPLHLSACILLVFEITLFVDVYHTRTYYVHGKLIYMYQYSTSTTGSKVHVYSTSGSGTLVATMVLADGVRAVARV
jgi:hypothetical protein